MPCSVDMTFLGFGAFLKAERHPWSNFIGLTRMIDIRSYHVFHTDSRGFATYVRGFVADTRGVVTKRHFNAAFLLSFVYNS